MKSIRLEQFQNWFGAVEWGAGGGGALKKTTWLINKKIALNPITHQFEFCVDPTTHKKIAHYQYISNNWSTHPLFIHFSYVQIILKQKCMDFLWLILSKFFAPWKVQTTPAMSTLRISILSLMSKWYFIPNIFSLYIFAFQLRLCQKRLTWSNRYLEVIFHALDVFSIIFASFCVEVKNRHSHRHRIVCFSYVHVLSEVRKSSKQKSKTIKVIYLLSIEQLILYLAQLKPLLFWYEIILNTDEA